MSTHINAQAGEIAPTVLLPGDPLRAQSIANSFLEDTICFNEVRGMLGFTGQFGEKRISIIGSGMGIPSMAIYVNELVNDYGVQTIIRVGTCGSLKADLEIGDLVLAITASTDSSTNKLLFNGMDFAPAADFDLLLNAYQAAQAREIKVRVGSTFTGDTYYIEDPEWWKIWADHNTLVCDMETNGLYSLAARLNVRALAILTVSDNLVTNQEAPPELRETGFSAMAEIALEIVP
jgi:purine-nucleoside phosphorylase